MLPGKLRYNVLLDKLLNTMTHTRDRIVRCMRTCVHTQHTQYMYTYNHLHTRDADVYGRDTISDDLTDTV